MASFPLEPNLAKMLVISEEQHCSEEMLTIVALLSAANIFIRYVYKKVLRDLQNLPSVFDFIRLSS